MVLKDIAKGTYENAIKDENKKNIDYTYQKKLGIGTFNGNIDDIGYGALPHTSSVCWCNSSKVTGILPYYESTSEYWFVLETSEALDNQESSIKIQKATIWLQDGNRVFERIFTNGEWYAWKEYLRTDGNLKDTTVSFTSGDDLNPTGWTAIGKIFSGAKLKDILNGFSTGIKNLRYLWKLCGENDISGLADGTITGALSRLNTDIQSVNGLKYINFGNFNVNVVTLDELVKEIMAEIIPTSLNGTYFGDFFLGATYRIIIQPYTDRKYAAAIVFSYALSDIIIYQKNNGVITKIVPNSVKTVI